ncbi:MAG: GatB/YqeY domain-containing protein [Bacteroidales bacterium]
MSLTETINNDIKEAMKAKQTDKLTALRAIKSEILLAQTAEGGSDNLSRETEIKILQKLVKQRKDSAEIYLKSGRQELYDKEIGELKHIEKYLPAQLTDEQLVAIIKKIISDTGASSVKDMGRVIGLVNKEVSGQAEGKVIAQKVKELLG